MRKFKLPYLILLALISLYNPFNYTHAANDVKTDIDTISGIQKTIFKTSYGDVIILLPDEILAGDEISGTIRIENAGNNLDKLTKYTVSINNDVTAVSPNAEIRFNLPKSSTGGVTFMVLRDGRGNELLRNYITYQNYVVNFNSASAPSPWEFQTPPIGRNGRFSLIKGPFDGNFGTTSISIGNSSVYKIAESPRQMVFENPPGLSGETELVLNERGTEVRRNYQSMQVVKVDEDNPGTLAKLDVASPLNKQTQEKKIPEPVKISKSQDKSSLPEKAKIQPVKQDLGTAKGGFIEEKELNLGSKSPISKDADNKPDPVPEVQTSKLNMDTTKKPDDSASTKTGGKISVNTPVVNKSKSTVSQAQMRYTVQIASYKSEKDAQDLVNKLESKGYDARIIKAQIPNKGLWYRIRLGAFETKLLANDYGVKLTREEPLITSMFVTTNN